MVNVGDIFTKKTKNYRLEIMYFDDGNVYFKWLNAPNKEYNGKILSNVFNKSWVDRINNHYHRTPGKETNVIKLLDKIDNG